MSWEATLTGRLDIKSNIIYPQSQRPAIHNLLPDSFIMFSAPDYWCIYTHLYVNKYPWVGFIYFNLGNN